MAELTTFDAINIYFSSSLDFGGANFGVFMPLTAILILIIAVYFLVRKKRKLKESSFTKSEKKELRKLDAKVKKIKD